MRAKQRVWVFADFAIPDADGIKLISDIGFSDVVLGVSSSQTKFSMLHPKQKLLDCMRSITDLGLEVHLMTWALRKPGFNAVVADELGRMYEMGNASSIIYNAEASWHKPKSLSAEAAAAEAREKLGTKVLGVAGLGQLHSTVAPLARVADYVIPECYSFWKAGPDDHWSHSPHTFPMVQQRRDWGTWSSVASRVCLGQACYDTARPRSGDFPGLSELQSMRAAASEALRIGREVGERFLGQAYWSLKHIIGRPERQEFLTRLCNLPADLNWI